MNRCFRVTLLGALAAALYACTDRSTAPMLQGAGAVGRDAAARQDHAGANGRLLQCRNQPGGQATQEIGPQGGRLTVKNNELIIPAGAVTRTVTITAIVPDDEVSYIQFEPKGLVFGKKPLLVLDAGGCDIPPSHAPAVVYINDAGAIVERIEARYYPQYKVVAAPIEHFSGYALAW